MEMKNKTEDFYSDNEKIFFDIWPSIVKNEFGDFWKLAILIW